MDQAKKLVAVIPDSCVLLNSCMDAAGHDDVHPKEISASRDLMEFIKAYGIGVVTEDLLKSTVHTRAAYDFSEREWAMFMQLVKDLPRIAVPYEKITANLELVESAYADARKKFDETVNGLLCSSTDIKKSKKKGVVSNRKFKKWARKVSGIIDSNEFEILKKKLYQDPADDNDRYLLSLGRVLKEDYQNVYIATEDAHMRPLVYCGEVGYVIYDQILQKLGVRCIQPRFVQKSVSRILRNAGVLEEQS